MTTGNANKIKGRNMETDMAQIRMHFTIGYIIGCPKFLLSGHRSKLL